MADLVEAIFDAFAVLLALGLSAYAFKLFRTLRGGLMHSSFRILAPAPLLFAAGELFDVADNLGVVSDPSGMIHISFEVLFMVALFVGFYQLAKVWNVKATA